MQTLKDIVEELDLFFVKKEPEHARHNFQNLVDIFSEEISSEEFHEFLNEMMRIRMILTQPDERMIAGACLSFILNIQKRPIVHKVMSFPSGYFETV